MQSISFRNKLLNRRAFLGHSGFGIGSIALASLLQPRLFAESKDSSSKLQKWSGVVNPLHHQAKIKRVIYLYMAGGPSHLETLDYKPKLA
jgi:hypothetical protein